MTFLEKNIRILLIFSKKQAKKSIKNEQYTDRRGSRGLTQTPLYYCFDALGPQPHPFFYEPLIDTDKTRIFYLSRTIRVNPRRLKKSLQLFRESFGPSRSNFCGQFFKQALFLLTGSVCQCSVA